MYLIESRTEENKGVERSSCVSVVHTFIAVFLISKISEDFADAFDRHIVHEWCRVTCVFMFSFIFMFCYGVLECFIFCANMKGEGKMKMWWNRWRVEEG